MSSEAIRSTVQSLQQVYTVVLALSLGEAFKQFVADTAAKEVERKIHWNRLLNLLSFLFLIVPFFQGMNRYLFDFYITTSSATYAPHLLGDCVAFTLEGSLFFVLSRSLSHIQWRRFYAAVVVLLMLDVVWGISVWVAHSPSIKSWVFVNLASFPILFVVRWCFKSNDSWPGAVLCMLIVLTRTILDYLFSWNFYFPD